MARLILILLLLTTAARAEILIIDGHNDAPWQIREKFANKVSDVDWRKGVPSMHTDLPRLVKGRVGGQFWSVYIPVDYASADAIRATFEQIDVVRSLAAKYPDVLQMAYTADDVLNARRNGRIACLIGIEGGHSIGGSPAALRTMYDLGARYMTLTHWKTHEWADASTDAPRHGGLSDYGRRVVAEMNRLGMLVDVSHVSDDTMRDALEASQAPVIASHSSAKALCGHPRNVSDDLLKAIARNGGVVMINFAPMFISSAVWRHEAARDGEQKRLEWMHPGDPKAVDAAMKAWDARHPVPATTVQDVADHVQHVARTAGIDHVGIGADYDGIGSLPKGLEDVSCYPALLDELKRRGFSDQDLARIAGGNVLRALRDAEGVARRLQATQKPLEENAPK